MEYARLGNTGLKVSRICLGCMGFGDAARWVLDEESSRSQRRSSAPPGFPTWKRPPARSR